ncbi:MAG: AMP-binding protein [Victivallales bacterium]|nr:AMP-binding protein [Victivallales bacterium]
MSLHIDHLGELSYQPVGVWQQRADALLCDHLAYLATASPFYRQRFSDLHLDPAGIRTVADLADLPLFTTKRDLEAHNDAFLAVGSHDVVDLCQTSGTTGRPVSLLQTRQDLERLAINEEVALRTAGLSGEDRVLLACTVDRCFMAGLAYFLGVSRLGALAIRIGASPVATMAEAIRMHRPTAMIAVPTVVAAVARHFASQDVDPASLGIRRIVCIGEPIRDGSLQLSRLGRLLAEAWGAEVLGTYASTEMATSFTDCPHGSGGHLIPDLVALELIGEDDRPVAPGELGEIVATPLQVTGMPLLRLRTGDMARLAVAPCACGRTTPRLGPIVGRKHQMLKLRGTTVYPPAIAAALQEIDEVQNYYIEVDCDFALADQVTVTVGLRSGASLAATTIAESIGNRIRVKPQVVIAPAHEVEARTRPPGRRKPVTFFDHRQKR